MQQIGTFSSAFEQDFPTSLQRFLLRAQVKFTSKICILW